VSSSRRGAELDQRRSAYPRSLPRDLQGVAGITSAAFNMPYHEALHAAVYSASRFSFTQPRPRLRGVRQGRACQTSEMSFLPDFKVLCDSVAGGAQLRDVAVSWREASIGYVSG